jgi:UDP-glucose 4-epimerase
VTGGAGFIGVNLVEHLVNRGHEVVVLDNLSTGSRDALGSLPVQLETGDVRDPAAVGNAISRCEWVVHLAASTSVLESLHDPWLTFDVNVRGTVVVLEEAVRANVERFVFASSNAALGETEPPIDESKPARPLSPYGASKLAGEGYCAGYHGSYGMGTVSLRFANAYGPRSDHKTSVVAKFLRNLIAGRPLTVYGDGRQTRDFVFVDDLVAAILLSLERAPGGSLYQIATGRETSVLDLIESMRRSLGVEPQLEWVEQPRGEIRRNYSSIEKARRELGYEPTVGLDEGLRRTYDWLAAASPERTFRIGDR